MDTTRPKRKRATEEYLEKESGERNVDGGLQVQLEEDEMTAQDRAGWSRIISGLGFTGNDQA